MIPDLALCAPDVPATTIATIVQQRSNSQPYALGIHRDGLDQRIQPKTLNEAVELANKALDAGFSIDVGVMQINSDWFRPMGYNVAQMYDPCTNIMVGMTIIKQQMASQNYAYNSGSVQASDLMPYLIHQESRGHHVINGHLVTSPVGAKGITQVMPKTGTNPGYGVTPLRDSTESEYIRFGQDYLQAMLNEFGGNAPLALAAYNTGAGNVHNALRKQQSTGISWINFTKPETQDYVTKIATAITGGTGISTDYQVPPNTHKTHHKSKAFSQSGHAAAQADYYSEDSTVFKRD